MNFEFKSTFNRYLKLPKGVVRLHHSAWIFLANASSTTVVIGLYFSNRLLPAAIVSRPHGMEYLALAAFAITIKIISTLYYGFFNLANQFRARSPANTKWLTSLIVATRERTVRLVQRYVYATTAKLLSRLSQKP